MTLSEPQFITDLDGRRVAAVLDMESYHRLLDALDEIDAIRAYDEAMGEEDEVIPFEQAIREIEEERRQD